jgi:hypothetical protein
VYESKENVLDRLITQAVSEYARLRPPSWRRPAYHVPLGRYFWSPLARPRCRFIPNGESTLVWEHCGAEYEIKAAVYKGYFQDGKHFDFPAVSSYVFYAVKGALFEERRAENNAGFTNRHESGNRRPLTGGGWVDKYADDIAQDNERRWAPHRPRYPDPLTYATEEEARHAFAVALGFAPVSRYAPRGRPWHTYKRQTLFRFTVPERDLLRYLIDADYDFSNRKASPGVIAAYAKIQNVSDVSVRSWLRAALGKPGAQRLFDWQITPEPKGETEKSLSRVWLPWYWRESSRGIPDLWDVWTAQTVQAAYPTGKAPTPATHRVEPRETVETDRDAPQGPPKAERPLNFDPTRLDVAAPHGFMPAGARAALCGPMEPAAPFHVEPVRQSLPVRMGCDRVSAAPCYL